MASGRKQKPYFNDLMMMRPGLRAQIPDFPSLSLESRGPPHYQNAGYENTESFTGSHYEDLDNQILPCPRKNDNAVYQQATPLNTIPTDIKIERQRQFGTACSDDSTNSLMHSSCKRMPRGSTIIIDVIQLIVSLVALTLVILMITGKIKVNQCGCDTKSVASQKYLTKITQLSISTTLMVEKIHRLERNVSSLMAREAITSSLVRIHQKEILELKSKLGGLSEGPKEESSANKFKQNITTEVKKLREKQVQLDSSLTKLEESDKTKATDIQEMSAKVIGLAVAVNYLSLNDSFIKSKVHKLSNSEVEFRTSLEALKQKDAEVDTSLKRAKDVEAFLNTSVNHLQSVNGEMKNKVDHLNSTFMAKINSIKSAVNNSKMPGVAGPPGPAGPQGPIGIPGMPGAGNLSQCQHQQKESAVGVSDASADYFVEFNEPKDKIVVGASCSTIRGDETNLSTSTILRGEKVYLCTCRGQSNFARGSGGVKCLIDVWVCPRIS